MRARSHTGLSGCLAAALLGVTLAGCGLSQPNEHASSPRSAGPSISSTPAQPLTGPSAPSADAKTAPSSASPTPVDTHEPPDERGGSIPTAARRAQEQVPASAVSETPQRALERFAALYVNWTASSVRAHQLELAKISVGAARLTSEQSAAQVQGNATLGRDSVSNTGQIVSLARGTASAHGYWVVVTDERTSGSNTYKELPTQLHVTYARVKSADGGWVVSSWQPQS